MSCRQRDIRETYGNTHQRPQVHLKLPVNVDLSTKIRFGFLVKNRHFPFNVLMTDYPYNHKGYCYGKGPKCSRQQ